MLAWRDGELKGAADALAGEDLHRAFALIAVPNSASEALHRRLGYRHVGTWSEAGAQARPLVGNHLPPGLPCPCVSMSPRRTPARGSEALHQPRFVAVVSPTQGERREGPVSLDGPSRNTIFRRLPVQMALQPREVGRHRLRVVFKRADLVVLGLGVTIGAGIFSLAGQQAASTAGPGVLLAFGIAAFACLVAGLCYAELSSVLPVSGSAYTFTYVIFGEVWGWLIGWALLLELLLAIAVVARVWSQYAVATLDDFGIALPVGGGITRASMHAATSSRRRSSCSWCSSWSSAPACRSACCGLQ